MGDNWKEHKIGDVAEVIGGGTPSTKEDDNFGGTIPWLTPKDLSGYPYRYISYGERNITEKGLSNSSAKILPAKSVLLTTRAPVGYVAVAKNPVTTNQGFRSLVLHVGFDPEFVYYLLKINTEFLKNHASGTTFGELSGSTLKSLTFLFPPLPEQKAIASILCALDDKIELNRKMNETLEAMARASFKSWFVDFNPIPGLGPHKKWHDSPLGKIPKGWRVVKVSDICSTQYGYTTSASEMPIGPHFLRITDMNKEPWIDWQKVPYCSIGDKDLPKYILKVGDVLVSRMADPGKAAIVEEDVNAVFASYLVRLKTRDLASAYYLFYFLRSDQYADYSNGVMDGSVQVGMNAKVITAANMLLPPDNIIINFLEAIHPLRKKITDNLQQSLTLASIRDSLLPKLLSGEIRIKNAERFVEAAL